MEIRKLLTTEIDEAMQLSLRVFMECGSDDFDDEGLKTFTDFLSSKPLINDLNIYGAIENDKIIGVLAMKNKGRHVSLFFVEKAYHGKGVGRRLFQYVISQSGPLCITVNSSTYAVKVYKRLGFRETDTVQTRDGLTFVPMVYNPKE